MDISNVSWMFKDQTLMFLCFGEGVFDSCKHPLTLPFILTTNAIFGTCVSELGSPRLTRVLFKDPTC